MLHSYTKEFSTYQGKVVSLGNALKNRRGEITSEGQQIADLERIANKIDWRRSKILQHSTKERELRKEIIKNGAKRNFAGHTLQHYSAV